MKAPITATKLRVALEGTRRSGRLRNPDPAPIVLLALAADAAATAATRDAIRGRGTRADQRAGELARTLAGVPPAIAAALSNPRALAWSFYESPIALLLLRVLCIHFYRHFFISRPTES